MCGGAIISDFISAPSSRRLTADFLWPDLKKWSGDHSKGQAGSEVVADNGFEADFRDFKDEVDADVKPFAFSATASKPQHHRDGDSAAKALPFSAAASETRCRRSKL